MSKDELEKEAEEINITYENNVFHCTKNGIKWISIDGEKWYGEEKRIEELEKENHLLGERCNQLLKDKGELTDKIADIKANCDFAIEGRDIKIKELEKENTDLRDNYDQFKAVAEPEIEMLKKENANLDASLVTSTKNNIERQKIIDGLKEKNAVLERRIERAKECMKKLLFIINSDPANYNCKGLTQDAEDFIYNRTCNIRQQGEHCISETRCIMCDKEIEK